jgi:Fe-S cluster assembly iron-binding protein IscA
MRKFDFAELEESLLKELKEESQIFQKGEERHRVADAFVPYLDGPGIDYHDEFTRDLGEDVLEFMHHIMAEPLRHAGLPDAALAAASSSEDAIPRLQLDHRTAQMIVDDTIEFIDKLVQTSLEFASPKDPGNVNHARANAGSWMTIIGAMQSMDVPAEYDYLPQSRPLHEHEKSHEFAFRLSESSSRRPKCC